MDFSALKAAVKSQLGVSSTDAFHSDTAVGNAVNEALAWIADDRDWPWLIDSASFTTTANDQTYTLPADWARTLGVTVNSREATFLPISDYRQYRYADQSTPFRYTTHDGELLISPAPPADLTVVHDYVKFETVLSGSSDTPLLPARFQWAAVARACWTEALRANDARAVAFKDLYNGWHVRMMTDAGRSKRRARIRPGYLGP